ncbi:MAG: phosphopentomutase [Defluviitaleaceae bacterium]|nr:phosphopentomutase [Defluviitaleaceae bacterium]
MEKRCCVIVLDSAGIGALPDAEEYGDAGSHTLGNIYKTCGKLHIPHLYALGLGNVQSSGLPAVDQPTAAYGRMAQKTKAKDTTSGHWELAGLIMDTPFRTSPNGFPAELLAKWAGISKVDGCLGNKPASGTHIIDELGKEHMETGKPIVYTSADSVFQVAAHEEIIPLPDLYRICEAARSVLVDEYCVGRVIARPFIGQPGDFKRTGNRRDYAVEPPSDTILDALVAKGKNVLGIGKIEDIFCNRGITHVNHTTNNLDGINATIEALKSSDDIDFIFTNLVDFDMLYGHRNDAKGYAAALEYFDSRLPEIIEAMRPEDILFITADHGCDPTTASTDHSREYVPVLVYGQGISPKDLGTRSTFADMGAEIYKILTGEIWPVGESFLCN